MPTNRILSPAFMLGTSVIIVLGLYVLEWPLLYNFNKFAFWDWGGYLVAHYSIHHGQAPLIDFGWQYGLLPLVIQEVWFRLVGASPGTFVALSLPVVLVLIVALRILGNLKSQLPGRALVLFSLPFVVPVGADLPHTLEPALLLFGLLAQAQGRRNLSLAFATAACFTKPSMGYLYGAVLIFLIVVDLRRQNRLRLADLASALAPAICTGLTLALVINVAFGPILLSRSLLPSAGARAYRMLHYGWGGIARQLFYFPGVRPGYYIGTPVAFLLIATIYLAAAAGLGIWRVLRTGASTNNYELLLTCAILYFGFLTLFYGYPSSWTYYVYMLVIGVVATNSWGSLARKCVWGLSILAFLANFSLFKSSVAAWKTMRRSPATAGLYAGAAGVTEWKRVASIARDQSAALFTWTGGGEVLFPWLQKPVGAFLVPGIAPAREIQAEIRQLESSKEIIIPTIPEFGNPLTDWPGPEFKGVLKGREMIFKGAYFEVYERVAVSEH